MGLGTALSGPAMKWAVKLPDGIPRLQERLKFLGQPIDTVRHFLEHAESYAHGATPATAVVAPAQGGSLSSALFFETANFASQFFTTILLLFFLLVSGDTLLRRLVEVLPGFSNKRRAVEISFQIEKTSRSI